MQNLEDSIKLYKDGVIVDRQKITFTTNPVLVPNASGGKPVIFAAMRVKTNLN